MVFDKTGTLTNGRPEVCRSILYVARSICPTRLFLTLVGVAESNSEHPLGQAITSFAKQELGGSLLGQSTSYEAVPGKGLKCHVSVAAVSTDSKSGCGQIKAGGKEMVVRRDIVNAEKSLDGEQDYNVRVFVCACVCERESLSLVISRS